MLNSSLFLLAFWVCFFPDLFEGAPWTRSNQWWNINFNPSSLQSDKYFGNLSSSSSVVAVGGGGGSPEDWRAESIYQVVTDRFSDGNPHNNVGLHFGFDGYDLRFVGTRHGGDFLGTSLLLSFVSFLTLAYRLKEQALLHQISRIQLHLDKSRVSKHGKFLSFLCSN
jgi:hypothetical protein